MLSLRVREKQLYGHSALHPVVQQEPEVSIDDHWGTTADDVSPGWPPLSMYIYIYMHIYISLSLSLSRSLSLFRQTGPLRLEV